MDEKDLIALNITFLRKHNKLSQLDLAEKLQYSNKNISKWEKGETTPSIFTLKRIAEIFEITVDDLVSKNLAKESLGLNEEIDKPPSEKKLFNFSVKLMFLFMANAILVCIAFILIFAFSVFNITIINKWLILLYILPLSALSVFIFVACIKKHGDLISISISGWLTALSIYLTFYDKPFISYVFIITATFQVLTVFVMLIINLKLINRIRKRLSKK